MIVLANKLPWIGRKLTFPDDRHLVISEYIHSIKETEWRGYDIEFKTGEIMKAFKETRWRSHWVFTMPNGMEFNTRYTTPNPIRDYVFKNFFTKLQKFEWYLKHHDWYYEFSDDHRYWRSGNASANKIKQLREELENDGLSKEVQALYDKYAPKKKE